MEVLCGLTNVDRDRLGEALQHMTGQASSRQQSNVEDWLNVLARGAQLVGLVNKRNEQAGEAHVLRQRIRDGNATPNDSIRMQELLSSIAAYDEQISKQTESERTEQMQEWVIEQHTKTGKVPSPSGWPPSARQDIVKLRERAPKKSVEAGLGPGPRVYVGRRRHRPNGTAPLKNQTRYRDRNPDR